jgi:hypothetical protein
MGKFLMWVFIILFGFWLLGTMQIKNEEKATAERVAKMNPEELQAHNNENCKWDKLGRYEYAIKQSLKDPESYKRIDYLFFDDSSLKIKYTATNSFGGRVQEGIRVYFEPDFCGEQVKLIKL